MTSRGWCPGRGARTGHWPVWPTGPVSGTPPPQGVAMAPASPDTPPPTPPSLSRNLLRTRSVAASGSPKRTPITSSPAFTLAHPLVTTLPAPRVGNDFQTNAAGTAGMMDSSQPSGLEAESQCLCRCLPVTHARASPRVMAAERGAAWPHRHHLDGRFAPGADAPKSWEPESGWQKSCHSQVRQLTHSSRGTRCFQHLFVFCPDPQGHSQAHPLSPRPPPPRAPDTDEDPSPPPYAAPQFGTGGDWSRDGGGAGEGGRSSQQEGG